MNPPLAFTGRILSSIDRAANGCGPILLTARSQSRKETDRGLASRTRQLYASNVRNEAPRPARLFLDPTRVAIGTGEIGVFRVDMKEIVTLKVNLLDLFGIPLGQDEVAGATVGGLDRCLAVGGHVFAVMTTETSIPVFVGDIVRVGAPIRFHFGEEILVINLLRDADYRLGCGRVGIGFA